MFSSYLRHSIAFVFSALSVSLSPIAFFFGSKGMLVLARVLWAPIILRIYGISLNVEGGHHIANEKNYIFVANHQSYLDIPVLNIAVKKNLYFVGKKELKSLPFIGWYMMMVGMVFIDRENRAKAIKSMEKAGEIIKKGKSIITFPEGTRSRTGNIGTFKKGTFYIAENARVEIVPIKIEGTEKVWSSESLKIKPGKVLVKIGKPISTEMLSKENMNSFIIETRNKLVEL